MFAILLLLAAALPTAPVAPTPPTPPAPLVAPTPPAIPVIPVAPDDADDTEDRDEDEPPPPKHVHIRYHGHHDDRVHIGSSTEVKAGETVGDAISVGGSTTISGHVRGSAVAVGGSVHVKPGARVDGDMVSVGGTIDVDDGATADGQRVSIGEGLGLGGLAGLAGAAGTVGAAAVVWHVIGALASIFGMIALGALFIAFIPERFERMKRGLLARPAPAGGTGLLVFIGIIPATILLVITLVGILVVPFLWMVFGLAIALGLALVAQVIGERVLQSTAIRNPFATLAVGALILAVLRHVPVFGWVLFFLATLLGVGAVLLTRAGSIAPASPLPPMDVPPAPPAPMSVPPMDGPPAV